MIFGHTLKSIGLIRVGLISILMNGPFGLAWIITGALIRWSPEGGVVSGDNLVELEEQQTLDSSLLLPSSGKFLNDVIIYLIIMLAV